MLVFKEKEVKINKEKINKLISLEYACFINEIEFKYERFNFQEEKVKDKIYQSNLSSQNKVKLLEKYKYCLTYSLNLENLLEDKFNLNSLPYIRNQFYSKVNKIVKNIDFDNSQELIIIKFNLEANNYQLNNLKMKYLESWNKVEKLLELYNESLNNFKKEFEDVKDCGGPVSAHTATIINDIGLSSNGFNFA